MKNQIPNHQQLQNLTDLQLERSIEGVRTRELETLSEMLNHLREIDRRRLYSKRGYRSLHDYAIRKLRYSEDQAHRRVSASRLVNHVPEIESKIADGSLKLTHLTDAHALFRKVEHSKEEKLQLLQKLENTTRTEARKVLQREDVNARYSFEADKSLEEAVEELRGLHAHLTFDELMRKVCLFAHERFGPARKMTSKAASKASVSPSVAVESNGVADADFRAARELPDKEDKPKRYIPTETRRQVWIKAQGKCECCSSKFALEYDHIIPWALGGDNSAANLRLLCRNCNQRKAIEYFGLRKMERFLLPKAPSS